MNTRFALVLFAATFCAPLFAQTPDSNVTPDTVKLDDTLELPQASDAPGSFTQVEVAFLRSVYSGDLDDVKVLVSKGADVNLRDQKKRTPLILAAYNGHTPVVAFLVGEGAEVNAVDGDSQTALMYASRRSFNETASLLLDNGAEVNLQSKKRNLDALMLAAVADNAELVRMLLDHGADASQKDIFGRSAKDLAEMKGNAAMVDMLSEPPAQESES